MPIYEVHVARIAFICVIAAVFVACGESPSSSFSAVQDATVERTDRFPQHPDADKTPGATCSNPSTYRYPERIPYCERNVSTSTKRSIIDEYDREFGYTIGAMNRGEFKIDHFIPLCMGGSNDRSNLWPQHRSVYDITDPMEGPLCELMAAGLMLQAEAIDTIRYAKLHLDEVPRIMDEINARRRH